MKRTKKNNKGFSLVELIVVVLIMAIIAVALAPQVMKWVNESRISTDIQMYDGVVSDLQTALTDSAAWEEVKGEASIVISIDASGVTIPATYTNLTNEYQEINPNYASTKPKVKGTSTKYEIELVNGAINRKTPPVSNEAK